MDKDELPQEGVFKMKFMQEAMKAKREAAKDEARSVLKDLEALDQGPNGDDDEEEDAESKSKGAEDAAKDDRTQKTFTPEELARAQKEVDEMIEREDEPVEFSVSGPLSVNSNKSVEALQAADKTTSLSGIAPGAILRPVEEQAEKDPLNPWLVAADLENFSLDDGNHNGSKTAKKGAAKKAKTVKHTAKAAKSLATNDAKAADESDKPWLAADELENFSLDSVGQKDADSTTKCKKETSKKVNTKEGSKKTKADQNGDNDSQPDDDEPRFPEGGIFAALDQENVDAATQREMVRTAFVSGSQKQDFEDEVELDEEEKRRQEEEKMQELPGWGSWAGEGIAPKKKRKHPPKEDKSVAKKPHVQVYKGKDSKASKYFVDKPIYPFQSAAQYEKTLRTPIGPEWNALPAHLKRVQPKIVMKVGAVVPPLSYVKSLPAEKQDDVIECWGSKRRKNRAKSRM